MGEWARAMEKPMGEPLSVVASACSEEEVVKPCGEKSPPIFCGWSENPGLLSAIARKIREPITGANGHGGYLDPACLRAVAWRVYGRMGWAARSEWHVAARCFTPDTEG
jgi:hypothetical protein